jgi:hypothetical protein
VALRFGVAPDALLGHGGEAWVYALDDGRVQRILREGGRKADVLRRLSLVEELTLAQPAYRLPEVLDVGKIEGRTYAIERRLPGRSVLEELGRIEGPARERLIEALSRHRRVVRRPSSSCSRRIRRPHRRRRDPRSYVARTWRSVRPGISLGRRPSSGISTPSASPADFPTHAFPRSSTWTRSQATFSLTASASPR